MNRLIVFTTALGALFSMDPLLAADGAELHVVGIYQGAGHITGQNNQGTARVHVDRPGRAVTLFLSSYDPVLWQVTASELTDVEKVFLDGYHDQDVVGLPDGTPVVETTYEGGAPYLSVGYSLDEPRTLGSIPEIEIRTGMKILSFHGTYEAPLEAILIDSIQNDPRLDSQWPQPVPPDQVPPLSFELGFWESVGVAVQRYTLQGPVDGGDLFPSGMVVTPDPAKKFYYAGDSEPFRFDSENGRIEYLPIPPELPELSWPRGIAFDTQRNRADLVTLGGEGFLYGYAAEPGVWSLIGSMNNSDSDSMTYHAPDDSLYVVLHTYTTIFPPAVTRLSPEDGSELGRIRLPALPFEIGFFYGARSEIVSVGEYLVLLLSQEPHSNQLAPSDSRIYLIDPRTGEVKLTWRKLGDPPPPPDVPAYPSEVQVSVFRTVPPPHEAPADHPWWGATVALTFDHPQAEVTRWGPLTREGNTFVVDIEAEQPPGPAPLPPRTITLSQNYTLGSLERGTYAMRVTSRGRVLHQVTFEIPPDPPPGGEILADVTLAVNARDPRSVSATAHIEFGDHYIVTGRAPVRRDEQGRFILEATVERTFVAAIFPPPPFPTAHLTYDLGSLSPGHYTAVFRMNDHTFAEKEFEVGDLPPPIDAHVSARIDSDGDDVTAHVLIALPNDLFIMTNPGEPEVAGHTITVDATFERNPHPSPLPVVRFTTHDYHLGSLAAGEYQFVFKINGRTYLEQPFTVPDSPPPPDGVSLAFIEIHQGDVSTAATVGLRVPEGQTIVDWGEVRLENGRFHVSVTVGVAPVPQSVLVEPPTDPLRHLERHVYSLGIVEPGDYRLGVYEGERLLGERAFSVGPQPPPPPPPQPLVAFIFDGVDATGSSWVEVGLAFPRPGLEVKDWGTPVLEENRFKVNIETGEAILPPIPTEPPAGGTPVFLMPPGSADSIVSPVGEWPAFDDIAGWPGHVVRHRYALGPLAAGRYLFVICLGGQEAARHGFHAGDPSTEGPVISVQAADIIGKSFDPHSFLVVYEAEAGFAGDPTAGTVTVNGPHGFSAEARRVGPIPMLAPDTRRISSLYEVDGPDGDWDAADDGRYSVCVDPAVVIDRANRHPAEPCAAGWAVVIEPDPPPHLPVALVVSMRDGRWFADVSFENSGGWWGVDWGEVRLAGSVFSAMARLHELPDGSLAPIPASFEHTYEIGELRPGRYHFVFRSDEGHCGSAPIMVPGVEPFTALDQWKFNLFGSVAPTDTADPDGDGLPLFGEYYLGCDPIRRDSPAIDPTVTRTPDGQYRIVLNFRRITTGDASLRCLVQTSDDMIHWRDGGEDVELVLGPPDIDGTRPVSASATLPLPEAGCTFLRLKVEHSPTP